MEELTEILENLNKVLDKIIEHDGDMGTCIKEKIEEAFKEDAEIHIVKKADGSSEIHTEGMILAQLITLAGLEKGILEKYHVPADVWEMIKATTGTKEAK